MNVITIFEQLANNVHYHSDNKKLIEKLPEKIRRAFILGDVESIKNHLSETKVFANESHVVNIHFE